MPEFTGVVATGVVSYSGAISAGTKTEVRPMDIEKVRADAEQIPEPQRGAALAHVGAAQAQLDAALHWIANAREQAEREEQARAGAERQTEELAHLDAGRAAGSEEQMRLDAERQAAEIEAAATTEDR